MPLHTKKFGLKRQFTWINRSYVYHIKKSTVFQGDTCNMFICRFTELIWAKSRWPVRLTDLVLSKNTQPPIKCQSEVFECILHHFDFLFQFAKRRGSLEARRAHLNPRGFKCLTLEAVALVSNLHNWKTVCPALESSTNEGSEWKIAGGMRDFLFRALPAV